jgi:hypothetical protein
MQATTSKHYKLPVRFGLGGVPLGNEFGIITEKVAHATLEAAWSAGVRYYDTSPWSGLGLCERRFGGFLHTKDRTEFIISSKVGKLLKASRQNNAKTYFPFTPSFVIGSGLFTPRLQPFDDSFLSHPLNAGRRAWYERRHGGSQDENNARRDALFLRSPQILSDAWLAHNSCRSLFSHCLPSPPITHRRNKTLLRLHNTDPTRFYEILSDRLIR